MTVAFNFTGAMASNAGTSVELDNVATTRPSLHATEIPQSSGVGQNRDGDEEDPTVAQDLQPADGGQAAWRLLTAAFVFEALMWGEHSNISVESNFPDGVRIPAIIWRIPRLLFPAA